MRDPQPIEFTVLGQTRIGVMPSIMVRQHLHGAELTALGYLQEDLLAGEPSRRVDPVALRAAYYACVGACWPGDASWASLREHRHDVTVFGEEVFDALYTEHHGSPLLAAALQAEGRRLLREMIGDLAGLMAEVKSEAGFTDPAKAGSPSSTA